MDLWLITLQLFKPMILTTTQTIAAITGKCILLGSWPTLVHLESRMIIWTWGPLYITESAVNEIHPSLSLLIFSSVSFSGSYYFDFFTISWLNFYKLDYLALRGNAVKLLFCHSSGSQTSMCLKITWGILFEMHTFYTPFLKTQI